GSIGRRTVGPSGGPAGATTANQDILRSVGYAHVGYACDSPPPPSRRRFDMAHPNEDLVRRGYEAFGTGDMATLNELFADDIVWHAPGRNQLAGTYRGKDEVFATFAKVAD